MELKKIIGKKYFSSTVSSILVVSSIALSLPVNTLSVEAANKIIKTTKTSNLKVPSTVSSQKIQVASKNDLTSNIETITKISKDSITVAKKSYKFSKAFNGLFANTGALKNARIQFTYDSKGNVTNVLFLELNAGGKASKKDDKKYLGNIVFDAKNTKFNGTFRVNADYVSLKNISISKNLEITAKAKSVFYTSKVTVKGKTTVLGQDQTAKTANASSPKGAKGLASKFYSSLSFVVPSFKALGAAPKTTVTKQTVQLVLVFEGSNLAKLEVKAPNTSVNATGKTTVGEVALSSNASLATDSSTTLNKVSIGQGTNNVNLQGNVGTVTVQSTSPVAISGDANVNAITISSKGSDVQINVNGTIQSLSASGVNSSIAVGEGTSIQRVTVSAIVEIHASEDLGTLIVNGNVASISIDAPIKSLEVNGNTTVSLGSNSKVDSITASGNITLNGETGSTVGKVDVASNATAVSINTPVQELGVKGDTAVTLGANTKVEKVSASGNVALNGGTGSTVGTIDLTGNATALKVNVPTTSVNLSTSSSTVQVSGSATISNVQLNSNATVKLDVPKLGNITASNSNKGKVELGKDTKVDNIASKDLMKDQSQLGQVKKENGKDIPPSSITPPVTPPVTPPGNTGGGGGQTVVTATVQTVSATNGHVTIVLDKAPTVAPKASDFVGSLTVDDGKETTVPLTNFAYDPTTHTVTFDFTPVAQTTADQNVVVGVTYNGGAKVIAPAYTVQALNKEMTTFKQIEDQVSKVEAEFIVDVNNSDMVSSNNKMLTFSGKPIFIGDESIKHKVKYYKYIITSTEEELNNSDVNDDLNRFYSTSSTWLNNLKSGKYYIGIVFFDFNKKPIGYSVEQKKIDYKPIEISNNLTKYENKTVVTVKNYNNDQVIYLNTNSLKGLDGIEKYSIVFAYNNDAKLEDILSLKQFYTRDITSSPGYSLHKKANLYLIYFNKNNKIVGYETINPSDYGYKFDENNNVPSEMTDNEAVNFTLNNLEPPSDYKYLSLDQYTNEYGVNIEWNSSNQDVVHNDGVVNQQNTDTTVTLTVKLTKGDITKTKDFTIIVPAGLNDSQAVQSDADNLSVYYSDTLEIDDNQLYLPTEGDHDSTIIWQSSDENIISNTGKVVHDPSEDKTVNLNATIIRGKEKINKTFTLNVKRQPTDQELLDYEVSHIYNYLEYNVRKDLSIPTKSKYGFDITWSSSDESIISNDGKVHLDNLHKEKNVTITMKFTKGELTKEGKFTVNVIPNYSDAIIVEKDLQSTWLPNEIYGDENNFSIHRGYYGSTITWESSDKSVISDSGKVVHSTTAKTVVITVTFKKGDIQTTNKYYVLVNPSIINQNDWIEQRAESLTSVNVSYFNGKYYVHDNWIYLNNNLNGYTVDWSSSNPDIINPVSGIVTRGNEDQIVTLTATVRVNSQVYTKDFIINVFGLNSDINSLYQKVPQNIIEDDDANKLYGDLSNVEYAMNPNSSTWTSWSDQPLVDLSGNIKFYIRTKGNENKLPSSLHVIEFLGSSPIDHYDWAQGISKSIVSKQGDYNFSDIKATDIILKNVNPNGSEVFYTAYKVEENNLVKTGSMTEPGEYKIVYTIYSDGYIVQRVTRTVTIVPQK